VECPSSIEQAVLPPLLVPFPRTGLMGAYTFIVMKKENAKLHDKFIIKQTNDRPKLNPN